MPKPFTENEKALLTERLMEEGLRAFSSRGLKKTSLEELTAAAGISKSAFYIFFESKEVLFMEVVERIEGQFRRDVLAVIDLPGPAPRARLAAALKKAFTLWKTIPILQFVASGEYELLLRRVPPHVVEEHMTSDRAFVDELILRCQRAGIPITAPANRISDLLYIIFFASLHDDSFGAGRLADAMDILLELTAAYFIGEVAMPPQFPAENIREMS